MALRHATETSRARRTGASVRVRSGSGGLEDRNAANTSLAGSWLRDSNPFGASYQDAPRPTATSVRVESLGNAPSRSACKAEQQPSASDPRAGPLGIAPSFRSFGGFVATFARTRSASYGFRSHLLRSTGGCPRQLTHEADVSLLGACGATCSAQCADEAGLTSRDLRALRASRTRFASAEEAARASRGERLGDVRVSIPSEVHSQCTGFASSLTSESSWLESNQHPSCSQGTCPATRLQLENLNSLSGAGAALPVGP